MALSGLAGRSAKPKENPCKLSDGGGLHVLVQPNGGKLWRLENRMKSREKLISFGPYPATALADARRKRDQAKALLVNGTDPSVERKNDRLAAAVAASNTFGALVTELLAAKESGEAASSTSARIVGCSSIWLLR